MKYTNLVILLLLIVLISCKQKKSTNEVKNSDQGSSAGSKAGLDGGNSNSSTANWSKKDTDDFVDECVKKASEKLSTGDAITYCRCMQKKVEGKYPDVQAAAKISNTEMSNFKDQCLRDNNISIGGNSGSNDDSYGSSPAWSSADMKEFKDNCVPGLITSMGNSKASNYCDCMLEKIMVASPDSKDAGQIGKSTMTEWAKDCLR
ncbi:MAG: hypothetical protein ABIQ56_06515 [Chitinophagaceae bacterium]